MKSPAELARRWAQQWENSDLRESRLINESDWPISLPIGRPTASQICDQWQQTAAHIRLWKEVKVGSVRRASVTFRATGAPVDVPVAWDIFTAEDWVLASENDVVRSEYKALQNFLTTTDSIFHSALIRERSLWRDKPVDQIIQAATLAMLLTPKCAQGKPLRAISLAGIDTKFFERHRSLVTRLLDLRFDHEASRQGLETFLDASREQDHWILLADLDVPNNSLQFPQLRVRSSDLVNAVLPARGILVVENENCFHALPRGCPGIIAILGTGNNLGWLSGSWFAKFPIAYWGDLDTWGLTLLARARQQAAHLTPLLMTKEVFDSHAESAVPEKILASTDVPEGLADGERSLYQHLLSEPCGRLEQEFLRVSLVQECVRTWAANLLS
jgi:hypothetical protein